jgi:hypothetical protein
MAFDSKAFLKAKFEPRTAEVRIDKLKQFFGEDEDPIFKLKGLTGEEYCRATESGKAHKDAEGLIKALTNDNEKLSALRDAVGILSTDVPAEIVKRLEFLTRGSADPVLDMTMAVKIAERFPIDFYIMTNTILELTGLGMDIKK